MPKMAWQSILWKTVLSGACWVILSSCAGSKPEDPVAEKLAKSPVIEEPDRKFKNLDEELATYIVEENTEELVRKASNLLTTQTSIENVNAAVYWRDVGMLFMGIEQVDWTQDSVQVNVNLDKKRWSNLSDELRFKLLRKIITELNNCVRANSEIDQFRSEIVRLKQENWHLTQKLLKLEKLLQDLEKVK